MKLTVTKQKQLDEAYDTLIQVCLYDRPLEDMAPLLADDVMNFGAGKKEITKTKEAFLQQIRGQKELAKGMIMDFKFDPVLRKVTNEGNGAIYTDDIVNTLCINGIETELKFRLSFIFEYRENKWMLVHSHTSAPDSQRTDDEIWPVEELKKRTAILEKSLDEKIAELEIKNQELQIEAALERTRAQSMMMQHSKQLDDTLRIFHEQVLLLGIKSAFSFLWLPDEKNERHIFWAAWVEKNSSDSSNTDGLAFKSKAIDYPLDRNEPATAQCLVDWKGKEPVVSYHVPPNAVAAYFAAWQELIAGVEQLKPEFFSDGLYYIEAFIKYGCFGVMVKDELSAEEKAILLRFAIEFERTYTRFLGLQKAEAQAMEARIEASLERIRSRAMAMRNTEELLDAADLVGKELAALGIESMNVSYAFLAEDHKSASYYSVNPIDGKILPFPFVFPHTETEVMRSILRSWENQEALNIQELDEEATLDHQTWVGHHIRDLFEKKGIAFSIEEFLEISPRKAMIYSFNFTFGYLFSIGSIVLSESQKDILLRVTKVFDMTYRRFLDLRQAESQAREAQIEAALERVRSRSMAMQKSEELKDVIQVVYDQFLHLNIAIEHTGFVVDYQFMGDWHFWIADRNGTPAKVTVPNYDAVWNKDFNYAKQQGLPIFTTHLDFEEKNKFYEKLLAFIPDLPEDAKEFYFNCPGMAASTVLFENTALYIENFSGYDYSEEENSILIRFGKVFEQAYARFMDLQKSEAQSRESQIQLAMERVRARTMAMQKSEELVEVASLLFDQVLSLGTKQWGSGFNIWHPENISATAFMANPDGSFGKPFEVPYTEDPFFKNIYAEKERGADFYVMHSEGSELEQTYRYMFSLPDARKHFNNIQHLGFQVPGFQTTHCAFFQQGFLMFITYEPVPEMWDIFKRFAKVFEQTYTRFLDLQKSEAQAREARIEAALERVRSRTMGMQHSHELQDAAQIMFQQIQELGVHQWACGYNIWEEDKKYCTAWMSAEGTIQAPFKTPSSENVFLHFYEASLKGEDLYVEEISGEACAEHYRFLSRIPVAGDVMKGWEAAGIAHPTHQIFHIAYFKQGYLMFITYDPVPEAHDIFRRFGKVFEQTYTRFLDLQKSEAQARESHIQLAMERVRARTMAMQHSNELPDAANLLFQQVQSLGMPTWSAGYCLWADNKNAATFFMSSEGVIQSPITMPLTEDPTLRHMRHGSDSPTSFYVDEIEGEVCSSHYDYMRTLPGVREVLQSIIDSGFPLPTHQINHMAYFPQGFLLFITYQPVPEAHDIFKRFARVFEQTYTRFLDLQRAEAQGLEAIKRASVDRVRAEIASMRTSADLEKITPLIWNELLTLEVPFVRCGVFIMDEENEQVNTFLSTPDGKAIAAFHQPFDSPGEINAIVGSWKKRQVYKQHWDEARFTEFTSGLVAQGVISPDEKYITENHPTDLYLHFTPFLQGMLYVGNTSALGEGELQLVQNLADAFSTAYARYEDFNKLEAAKEQVDKTLSDLKQTQAQLVQAEKMASLGELTAGIAHEIQNPLNFVNNFSELSNELISEMEEEMDKGNSTEAKQIAEDIRTNLEKINLHGKRADAIVKGMLQHSRTSSGEKQPTDINALADEYLRLAYHGLRAKDKTFNATLETDFDQSIGKINIIPQDIGRVLLNLISNAFYAVDEKKKSGTEKFEPKVSVNTKMVNGSVDIIIMDNGNGIPGKVKDKIFQPFFTTKPTGQGTGLGLSLAYDIVKAHGGEIKAETKEREGTSFTINIPIN